MKKKCKALLITAAVFMTMLALTGCGREENGEPAAGEDKKPALSESKKDDNKEDEEPAGDPALSELIYGNDVSIWYVCDTVDKEKAPGVYVLYGDGTYISVAEDNYSLEKYTFGELSKMTDEEIIAWAESQWAVQSTQYYCEDHRTELYSLMSEMGYSDEVVQRGILENFFFGAREAMAYDSAQEQQMAEGCATFDPVLKQKMADEGGYPKFRYGISLFSDASGNYIESENLYLEERGRTKEIKLDVPQKLMGNVAIEREVYESRYSGFRTEDGKYLLSRIETPGMIYNFDSLDTEGLFIDEPVSFE